MSNDTSTAMGTATYIAECLRTTMAYAQLLVNDVPAEKFAHMPHPNMNHPAFCIGHLALYPELVLNLLGRGDLAIEDAQYSKLFDRTATCVEGEGSYPEKDEIMARFNERYQVVLDVLSDVPEEVFQQANLGPLKERFATVGGMVNFMLAGHTMLHLGQISAWRRAMGLGSVM